MITCTHPVQRRGTLGTCRRPATVRAYDVSYRPGYGRPLCTAHAAHGRFRPFPWADVRPITDGGTAR